MFPRAKKSFGQNFLADPSVVGKIVAAAGIKPGERVLEIGPGTGVLTRGLLETGARVTAVEADADLLPALRETFPGLDLREGDVLALRGQDPSLNGTLEEGGYVLAANIPYNITSGILEEFLRVSPRPKRLVLMVQREVADRITAAPPQVSLLSVVCQTYAEAKKAFNVPAGAFRPVPKVDSAVIVLELRPKTAGEPDPEDVIALAKAGFSSPRKQLHKNVAQAGLMDSVAAKALLEGLGLRPDIRAEGLTAAQWQNLWKKWKTG